MSRATTEPRLVNSILWGNLVQNDSQIFSSTFAQTPLNLLVDATTIQGGCVGATDDLECLETHDLDPQFVDLLAGDLHLMPGSPLHDLGALEHLPPDLADLDEDGDLDEPTPVDLDDLERVVDAAPELGPLEIP